MFLCSTWSWPSKFHFVPMEISMTYSVDFGLVRCGERPSDRTLYSKVYEVSNLDIPTAVTRIILITPSDTLPTAGPPWSCLSVVCSDSQN
jgi:hypothetical protein